MNNHSLLEPIAIASPFVAKQRTVAVGYARWFALLCMLLLACGKDPKGVGKPEDRDGSQPEADAAPDAAPEKPLIVDGLTRVSLGDRERSAVDGFHWGIPEDELPAAAVRLAPFEYPFEVRKVVYDLVDFDYNDTKGVVCDPALPHSVSVGTTAGASPPATFDQTYEVDLGEPVPEVTSEAITLRDRNEKRDVPGTRITVTLSEPVVLVEGQSLVIALFLGVQNGGDGTKTFVSCPTWDFGDESNRDRSYVNVTDPVQWVTKMEFNADHFLSGSDKDLTFEMLGTTP